MRRKKKIYLLPLLLALLLAFSWGCSSEKEAESQQEVEGASSPVRSLALSYATEYSVDFYQDGYAHIVIEDGNDYVLIPEGMEDNNLGFQQATLIHQPCDNIYLAASSAMDFFLQLDSLDQIKACSATAEDYSMDRVRDAINQGQITYVGKYSAPSYETLVEENCSLAIESTMIYHSPKIKEELEALDIPVLVERSSYEESPLGRLEWVKLYGLLLGKEEEAETFFSDQVEKVEALETWLEEEKDEDEEPPVVVFFSLSSNGYVTVRKPKDYVSLMVSMAGGCYGLNDLEVEDQNALSTVNMNWEDFYRDAVDADILIYNGTIDGGICSLEDLEEKNPLFADFTAVKNGKVYCTNLNMFQQTSKLADVILDFHHVIAEDGETLTYLRKVE